MFDEIQKKLFNLLSAFYLVLRVSQKQVACLSHKDVAITV